MTVVIDGDSGITAPALDSEGNLEYSGTLTGGTGIVNLGSGQVYKTAGGNVGINTTTPSSLLHVFGSVFPIARIERTSALTNGMLSTFAAVHRTSGDMTDGFGADVSFIIRDNAGVDNELANVGAVRNGADNSGAIAFRTNLVGTSTEKMRINAEGNLCLGSTSQIVGGANHRMTLTYPGGGALYGLGIRALADNTVAVNFANAANAQVGNIYTSGSTTAYNTSSDYRLKENVAPMTGALEKVAALKPCTYTWKSTGEAGQGFIAHELQAVVPDCVTGTKDAVDKDGKPRYQGVDTSFLIATLVSAIQELKAEFDAYKLSHP